MTNVDKSATSRHGVVQTTAALVVDELHAKRLSVQALSAELAALDAQLEVLERSLAPVQSWSHQWSSARNALTQGLSSVTSS